MPNTTLSPVDFANQHFTEFVERLKALVRLPSISFDGFPPEQVRRSAEAVAKLLTDEGLEHVEILEIPGAHPYVYADWLHAPGAPTLLLYAHHDVQPPGREEKWETAPFEPVQKGDRLFGRGAADDKAGIIVHAAAIAAYLRTEGKLPVNVKLLIEGEEETGSGHLQAFLEKYRSKCQADVLVLTDTANFDVGIPTITTSLRGIVAVEVDVKVMERPLHSGMWGGPIPDPVLALAKMLAGLVDDEGRITIPGIYDEVRPLTDAEKESIELLNYRREDLYKQAALVDKVEMWNEKEPILRSLSRLPSLAVNAIQASSRKNASNIINDSAWCKVGIRTVPDMDGEKTLRKLCDYLLENAPWGVEVSFRNEAVGPWWVTNPEGIVFEKARAALTKAFGRPCVYLGQGGSIPFVGPFSHVLGGAPALLIGVEDPYTNAHSENESVHLGDLQKSIVGAIELYAALARD